MKNCFSTISDCKSCISGFTSNSEYDFIVFGSQPNLRLTEVHLNILCITYLWKYMYRTGNIGYLWWEVCWLREAVIGRIFHIHSFELFSF